MKPWAIFFGLFLLFIIVLADIGNLGWLGRVYSIPYGDKVGHFVLFGLLSFVVDLSLFQNRPAQDRRRLAMIASLIIITVIGLEEISQNWFPTRSADLFDWLSGCAGVILFSWLAVRIKTGGRT